MKKYEYDLIKKPGTYLKDTLNEKGNEGWMVVFTSFNVHTMNYEIIMMRELIEKKEQPDEH